MSHLANWNRFSDESPGPAHFYNVGRLSLFYLAELESSIEISKKINILKST